VELVGDVFVLNMTLIEDYKGGIFLSNHWKLQNYILRTADYTMKKACGIYEIEISKGRLSYKIFAEKEDLCLFLKKNKDKTCKQMAPVFTVQEYKEYPHTEVRKLTSDEIMRYMSER